MFEKHGKLVTESRFGFQWMRIVALRQGQDPGQNIFWPRHLEKKQKGTEAI